LTYDKNNLIAVRSFYVKSIDSPNQYKGILKQLWINIGEYRCRFIFGHISYHGM